MNKEQLQIQIKEMRSKLFEMESELNKPEVTINYFQPLVDELYWFIDRFGYVNSAISPLSDIKYRFLENYKIFTFFYVY